MKQIKKITWHTLGGATLFLALACQTYSGSNVPPNQSSVQVSRYELELTLFPAEAKVQGTATLELKTRAPLRELALDAVGLLIKKVWLLAGADGSKREIPFALDSSLLHMRFPEALPGGKPFLIQVDYSASGEIPREAASLGRHHGLIFTRDQKTTTAVYTSSIPELARTWFPCIDGPNAKAARSVLKITAPEDWSVVSNGSLKRVDRHSDSRSITFEWQQDHPIATYLISFVAGPYIEIKDPEIKQPPVSFFAPRKLAEKTRAAFGRTRRILEYFESLWGPYPFEKYSITTVPFYLGAMENTNATIIAEDLLGESKLVEDISAHELAHQWWGDLVTPASWDDLWLSEGLAGHAELLFEARFNGERASFDRLLKMRRLYFKFDKTGICAIVDPQLQPGAKFSPTLYAKAPLVLRMLREELGDEAFQDGLRSYLGVFRFGNATTLDFQKILERASGRKLGSFFRQWVYGRGYPYLSVQWRSSKNPRSIRIEVRQKASRTFSFGLELRLVGYDSEHKLASIPLHFDIRQKHQVFIEKLAASLIEPLGIAVDPESKTLLRRAVGDRTTRELKFWLSLKDDDLAKPMPLWAERLQAIDELQPNDIEADQLQDLLKLFNNEAPTAVREAIVKKLRALDHASGSLPPSSHTTIRAALQRALTDSDSIVRGAAAFPAEPPRF